MNPPEAEALRRSARQQLGLIVDLSNDPFNVALHKIIGIRMRVSHYILNQPNPIGFYNIKEELGVNITNGELVQGLVDGEYNIDVDAISQLLDEEDEVLKFLELNHFVEMLNKYGN